MLRIVTILSVVLGAAPAHAMTTAFFKQDGSQASIIVAGMPGDADAGGLYNALSQPPEDFQGKWSKKLPLKAADGSPAADIDCVFSKQLLNNGSCTVILRRSPGLIDVNVGAGQARLTLTGAAAAKVAASFAVRGDSPLVYRSRDGRLSVLVTFDAGAVSSLIVDWNGKGL